MIITLDSERGKRKITGYWYEKKNCGRCTGRIPKIFDGCGNLFKVLTPEFKPDYYSNLQDIFGCGQVKNMTDFMKQIVEYMPYSESDDGGINVMKNVWRFRMQSTEGRKLSLN